MKVLFVINKDKPEIGASETFLKAHLNAFEPDAVALIGNPGYRVVNAAGSSKGYMSSRSILPLGLRWLIRKVLGLTVEDQDTRALVRLINKYQVDVVLAEYGPTAVSVMEACSKSSVPLVTQFHGYDASRRSVVNYYRESYARLFRVSSSVIAVSKEMYRNLEGLGCDPAKLYHNACGAELPEGLVASPQSSEQKIVMVGRLVEKKAPFLSILAFSKVVKAYDTATLEILGDGLLMDACQQLCEALGIKDQVTFHGACSHEFVLKSLASARCFIQHSVTAVDGDTEGTPVGVLEAMGLGLPVVSTRHAGIKDIIEEGRTGFLVDEYDWRAMAECMLVLARDADLAQHVGELARATVVENWTSEKSCDRLFSIVKNAANSSVNK